MAFVIRAIAAITLACAGVGCAGVRGQPESIQVLLQQKYVGRQLQEVVLDLGAPASSFKFDDGRVAYTWRRLTDKYRSNVLIKSDERCVITMLSDRTGRVIETIGTVDDSLGAFRLSYCAEQFGW
jgi:hypothetical protein